MKINTFSAPGLYGARGVAGSPYSGWLPRESVRKSVARQDAELQAVTWMCQTAPFAVWERLLRTDSRGSLRTPVKLRSEVYFEQQCAKVGMTGASA